ncbi:DNA-directed DNA polymerase [Tanacetum coccineum]
MEEINNFQQEPDETFYQSWERFKELLMKCPQHYLMEMQEVILFYNGLDVQTRQILDSKGAIPSKTVADAKVAIQEMAEYSQKWHNRTSRIRSTETSNGLATIQAQLNNIGREIMKVNEKVYAAQVGCGYRAAAPGFYQRNNANPSYQERRQSMEETLSKFMSESSKRHEENCNMIKEIQASTDAEVQNQGASIKTLEIQIGQISKVIQERGFGSLPSSTETNLRDHVKSILTTAEADSTPIRRASVSVMPLSTYLNLGLGELAYTKLTIELADKTVKYPKGIAKNVPVVIGKFVFPIDFIILNMLEDVKVPLILRRPVLSTARAKIDVFKRNITLRVGDEKIIFKSVKSASSLIMRVYMLSLRERMELDLEARLMGETLVEFYNFIIRDEVEHKGKNVVEAFMNVPIFVRNFSVVTHFVVVENMDGYRDQDMGDIILGELFCKASCVKQEDLAAKEIDNVGEVSTIWKSRSVGVLKSQDGCSTQYRS